MRMLRIATAMLLTVAILALNDASGQPPKGKEAAKEPPPSPVFVSTVIERQVQAGQSFVGTVKPVKMSVIGSAVDGRVEEFLVNEGDFIKKGDTIAKLRTGTLEIERDVMKAELRLREAELKEMENGSRKEEKEAARASLASAEARRNFARANRERLQNLFRTARSVSENDLQEAVASYEQAEQNVQSAKANFDLVMAGPRQERIEQARARLEAAAAIVRKLEDQIFLHTVRAYYDGYVTMEHCEVGQWLMKGQAVVEMVKLDEVEIEVGVTEDAVANLQIGAPARIDVNGIADNTFTGTVSLIVPQANMRSRTFPVKVRVPNPIRGGVPLLKSHLMARITLPLGKMEQGLMIPKDAVVLGGPSPMVFVAASDPSDPKKVIAKPVPVQLGITDGALIQIKGDIAAGMKVVSQGNERVRPGQSLAIAGEWDGQAKNGNR